MARAKKDALRIQPAPSREELEEQISIEEDGLLPAEWEESWKQLCNQQKLNVWDRLAAVPKEHWDECTVYLYRLEPKVSNKGEYAYIDKYKLPFTVETLGNDHHGGRYEIYLKRRRRELLRMQETLDPGRWGSMRVLDGQRVLDTSHGAAGNGGSGGGGDGGQGTVAETIRAAKELMREVMPHDKNAAAANAGQSAVVDMMKTGFQTILEAKDAASKSATGNPLADQIVANFLSQKNAAATDPIDQFIKMANALKAIMPEPPPPPTTQPPAETGDFTSQLPLLKFLGVDSLEDLIKAKVGGKSENPFFAVLAQAGVEVAKNLPACITILKQWSAENFHRQLLLAKLAGQIKELPPDPPPTAQATPVTPNQPTPPTPAGEIIPPDKSPNPPNAQEEIQQAVVQMVRYFEAGKHGAVFANVLQLDFPQTMAFLADAVTDRTKLDALVVQVPLLQAAATKNPKEWSDFLDEFMSEFEPADDTPGADEETKPEPAKVQ
jgi:hypothetical protein